jgi:hypothetical protein
VLLGAVVALQQLLRRERAAVLEVVVGMVAPPQLERIELEPCRELVQQALEPVGPLDEAGCPEGGVRRQVQLGAVGERAHVVAGVEHLERAVGRSRPARPPDRVHVLGVERDERAVGARAYSQPLNRRVAVAGREILFSARKRAAHRAARLAGERDRDVGVVAGVVLRAEAAAHVVADDPHPVGGQLQLLGDRRAHAPDELRRDVDLERVSLPAADRLVGLHRVVQHGLRSVLALDDHVRLGEAGLDVAAVVAPRVRDERLAPDRLLGIEQRVELLPLDLDRRQRLASPREAVGRDRRDRRTVVAGLGLEDVAVVGADRAEDAG